MSLTVITKLAGTVRGLKRKLAKRVKETERPRPKAIEAIYDGQLVPDLAAHIVKIRDAARKERELQCIGKDPDEGYRDYVMRCHDLYKGNHTLESKKSNVQSAAPRKPRPRYIQNRIQEKIDDVIVPGMIQHQPSIAVRPRTAGDVPKAELLNTYLHTQLKNSGFEAWNIALATNIATYGRGVWYKGRRFDRNEPYGQNDTRVLGPLAVAWLPANVPLEQARTIVHVELWDKTEAQAHFALMQMRVPDEFEHLPTGGESHDDIEWWHLERYVKPRTEFPDSDLFPKTLITYVWCQDAERINVPETEMVEEVVPDEYVSAEGEQLQSRTVDDPEAEGGQRSERFRLVERQKEEIIVDPETGKEIREQIELNKPFYPYGRLTILAGDDFVVYDGDNPHKHNQFPYGCAQWRDDGESFCRLVEGPQMGLNRAYTQMGRHSDKNGTPASLYYKDFIAEEDRASLGDPGAFIPVKRDSQGVLPPLNNVVRPLIVPPINPSVGLFYDASVEAFERGSGIAMVSQGQTQSGQPAALAARLDEHSMRRLEIPATNRDATLERLGRFFLFDIFQWDSKKAIARTLIDPGQPDTAANTMLLEEIFGDEKIGEDGQREIVPRKVLDYDIELQAVTGNNLTSRQARLQTAAATAQAVGQPATYAAKLIDDPNAQQGAPGMPLPGTVTVPGGLPAKV